MNATCEKEERKSHETYPVCEEEKSWYSTLILHVRSLDTLLLSCMWGGKVVILFLYSCCVWGGGEKKSLFSYPVWVTFPQQLVRVRVIMENFCVKTESLLSLFYVKYWSNVFKKHTFFFSHEGLEARPISASCKINVFFPLHHMNCRVMEWL